MGLNLTQDETRELLDTIMTVLEEKRINAGQQFELAKREARDAESTTRRQHARYKAGFLEIVEEAYQGLVGEIDHVISDVCGDDWREWRGPTEHSVKVPS